MERRRLMSNTTGIHPGDPGSGSLLLKDGTVVNYQDSLTAQQKEDIRALYWGHYRWVPLGGNFTTFPSKTIWGTYGTSGIYYSSAPANTDTFSVGKLIMDTLAQSNSLTYALEYCRNFDNGIEGTKAGDWYLPSWDEIRYNGPGYYGRISKAVTGSYRFPGRNSDYGHSSSTDIDFWTISEYNSSKVCIAFSAPYGGWESYGADSTYSYGKGSSFRYMPMLFLPD